jgi:hypothetical protein
MQQKLEELRGKHPLARWLRLIRSRQAIFLKLVRRSIELGRPVRAPRYAPKERRLLDRYARAFAHGRYRSGATAARAYLEKVARLRQARPGAVWLRTMRSLDATHAQIWTRSRKFGLRPTRFHWAAPELAVVDRYVRQMARGRFRRADDAAVECRKALERLRLSHPDAHWASMRRTLGAIGDAITARAHELGLSWAGADWLPREDRIINEYVKAVMQGRFPTVYRAGCACWDELNQRVYRPTGRRLHVRPAALRTLKAILTQLELRTVALGRPKTGARFRPAERAIALKWARRYLAAQEKGIELTQPEAVRQMRLELKRRGYMRPQVGCRGWLEKFLYSLRH